MPNRPVTIRRWEVVGAFLLLIAIAIAIATWNDHRIDQAEKRISRNSARAEDLAEANRRQDALRGELLRGLQDADRRACERIENLKAQNRIEAEREFDRLDQTLALIGIEKTPKVEEAAKDRLLRELKRNAPAEC